MQARLLLALAAPLLAAAPALAQDAAHSSRALYINGTAPSACVIRGATAGAGQNAAFSVIDASHGQIDITQLVDPTTAEPRASDIQINLPVTCNASHRVRIASREGGLLRLGGNNRGPANGGFTEFLPYQIGIDWAGSQLQQQSDAGAIVVNSPNGAIGNLSVRVATPAGGNPLVAGQYDDSITIQFEPAS
ncbi:MAG: spore coat protein U domain-containing protein [Novosphingobium sp.]|jgi:spore coat protein U-like protein